MTDISLYHVANIIKRAVVSFVGGCKLEQHNPERVQEIVNFFGSFKSHVKSSVAVILYNHFGGRKVEFTELEQY
jgi:hypothetical protein